MGLRFFALLLFIWSSAAFAVPDEPKRVLLLDSFRSALPINAVYTNGIAKGLNLPGGFRVETDSEFLDLSRIDDEDYVRKLIEIYQLKYRTSPPSVIIPIYTPALRLLLRHREELFPNVPIVFCGAELTDVEATRLPANVTGVTSKRDFAGTLEMMSRLQPDLRRVALIVGSGEMDKQWEEDTRQSLQPYEGKFEFIWLRGMPVRELTETVKTLPDHTAILYVVQFKDRDGVPSVPLDVAHAVSTAANAPVYGLWDTLIGAGIVGGRLRAIEHDGIVAGQIARRILAGETVAAIPVVMLEHNDAIVDARQLKRWGIDEHLLPEGTQVVYRERSVWDQYRDAILIAGGVIVLQSVLIVALLMNRKRLRRTQNSLRHEYDHRVQAETVSRRLQTRLDAAEKHGTLGALTAGIAHELGQPLIAIKNYAQAAKRYVATDSVQGSKVAELLAEMEGEAGRAGAIIQKVRKLLDSGHVDAVMIELDPVLQEVFTAMRPELDAQGCWIDYRVDTPVPATLADPLEIQLVMVNLLRNAAEAMETGAQGCDKRVSIRVGAIDGRTVQVSVADCGAGVPAAEIENIFDPLYSTKAMGMGVGLATCRTVIEAHGGSIWYTPNPSGGAMFRFTLPVAEASR